MNHNLKILIVEDSPTILGMLTKLVSRICEESSVFGVKDGEDALRFLTTNKVDLIISDLNVDEGVSGEAFIRKIKKNPVLSKKQIIIFRWLWIGFMVPPVVWLSAGLFFQIWNLEEMIRILLSPYIWIYVNKGCLSNDSTLSVK